ncbi:SDR family NAD(P)-dependent oxidoreductase [Nocardia sp. alder85J]|uniref:SDR family NAD(P)-dependent oxidoreductase n=1 Tax=Nocardia sp. alder85J TaxID=2862949 RepID=UPI001CD7272C|nr:SDR family oxidoreductase [Nocardia sp. alder85J]MCX4092063.1 SDR family oxidoreductase [Nocardia sp. alder85J]
MARRAVVSGGGTGIGKAVARRLASDGDEVVIVGRRIAVLEAAAARINTEIGADRVDIAVADLTVPEEVRAVVERITASGHGIDVVINNAGGNPAAGQGDLGAIAEAYLESYRLNVVTAVLLTEALLPHVTRSGGRIVSISSIAALRGAGAYGAAKAALHGWALGLAQRLAPEGITVNVVAPGFVPDTEFWSERLTPELAADRIAQIPLGRAGTPEEIAAGVAHLASAEAAWTTGQILQINGGTLLGRG